MDRGGGPAWREGGGGVEFRGWLIRGGENDKTFPTDVSRNCIFVPFMIRLLDKTSLKRVSLTYGLAIEKVRYAAMK